MRNRSRRFSAAIPAMALVAAMLVGGSGSLVPLPELGIECLLAALATVWVWTCPGDLRCVPRSAWIIAALLPALPLGQLLPLPPSLWQNLPGRPVEQAALDLIGQGSHWRCLSLTPDRTLAALLAMIAAAAMLVMAAAQDRRGRAILLAVIAAMAALSVLFGAAQLSGGAGNRWRFYNPAEAFLDGFQNNHNAQADVLLVGMIALSAAAAEFAAYSGPATLGPSRMAAGAARSGMPPQLLLGIVGGITLLLILAIVLTASRTGIALLPVAIAAQALILRRWLGLDKRRMAAALVVVATTIGAAALAVVAGVAGDNGALAKVWTRFHTATEFRPVIWRDAVFALRQVWPWGAGMGSFIPVFAAAERLEVVTSKFVNRAHDDYLEFLIEAGLPGVIVFGVICRQIAMAAYQGWRRGIAGRHAQLLCGGMSLVILALHSLDDYPLRTISIACMTAVNAAVLLPIAERGGPWSGYDGDDI